MKTFDYLFCVEIPDPNRYPATGAGASFKAFKVHAPGTRSVCFLDKGVRSQQVISVGENDRCVAQVMALLMDKRSLTITAPSYKLISRLAFPFVGENRLPKFRETTFHEGAPTVVLLTAG